MCVSALDEQVRGTDFVRMSVALAHAGPDRVWRGAGMAPEPSVLGLPSAAFPAAADELATAAKAEFGAAGIIATAR